MSQRVAKGGKYSASLTVTCLLFLLANDFFLLPAALIRHKKTGVMQKKKRGRKIREKEKDGADAKNLRGRNECPPRMPALKGRNFSANR